jgi:hypothetical protein
MILTASVIRRSDIRANEEEENHKTNEYLDASEENINRVIDLHARVLIH